MPMSGLVAYGAGGAKTSAKPALSLGPPAKPVSPSPHPEGTLRSRSGTCTNPGRMALIGCRASRRHRRMIDQLRCPAGSPRPAYPDKSISSEFYVSTLKIALLVTICNEREARPRRHPRSPESNAVRVIAPEGFEHQAGRRGIALPSPIILGSRPRPPLTGPRAGSPASRLSSSPAAAELVWRPPRRRPRPAPRIRH